MAISHAPLERKRTRHRVKRWRHVSRLLASFAVFRQDDSGSANRIECDRPYVGYSFHLSFHNLHTEGGLEVYERYFGRPLFAPWAERVVVDVNDAMLEVAATTAAELASAIEWRQGTRRLSHFPTRRLTWPSASRCSTSWEISPPSRRMHRVQVPGGRTA